ncbi:MAG: helix-turn-helix domain-containing protein [Muribaculaceae bacterium]|nr:helix-turn-helix domain-containing protein [Muribaculaceae bacterium]
MRVRYNFLALVAMLIFLIAFPPDIGAEGRLFRKVPSGGESAQISQTTVYDIKRTDDGYTWIAAEGGLFRFDGEHTARILLPDESKGIAPVKSLAPLHGGGLIIGTNSTLYHLSIDKNSYKIEALLEGKPFSATCGMTTASGDAVIGGDDGLVVYSPASGKTTHIKLDKNILKLTNNVIDLAPAPEKFGVYVLTKGGIFLFDRTTFAVTPIKTVREIGSVSPESLAATADRLFIGTTGEGVLELNPVDGTMFNTQFVGNGNVVTSLETGSDGKFLYIGTDGGGVVKIDLATGADTIYRHHISDLKGPTSNQVYSLLSDPDGVLWMGYYQNGVDYTPESRGPFRLYDNPSTYNSRGIPVRALSINPDYSVIGTREGAIVYIKKDGKVWRVESPELRSEMVISLLNKGGKIYVGTYGGGMQVLDPKTKTVTNFAPAKDEPVFKTGHVFALASDADGDIWAGTNDGLFQFDVAGGVKHFTSNLTALPEGNVYGIFFDSEGKGWICTESGVCIYDPERKVLRTDLFPVAFPKQTRFRTVYEDSRGRLYFVPETGYVYSCNLDFSNPRTLEYPMIEGTDAKSVVEDTFGNIWIATNRGIFRTDSIGNTTRFGLASGLPSVSFLQAQPLADGEGGIWFGNSEGLLRLDEKSIDESIKSQRQPVPTIVYVNDHPLKIVPEADKSGVYSINIDTPANNLKIDFATFSYAIEEPDAYEYSLDNAPWQRFKDGISVSFYDLMPGSHTLRVRAANVSNPREGIETVVRLHLPYPLSWKLGLFTIVILLLVSIGLAFRVFIRYSKKDKDTNYTVSDGSPAPAPAESTPQKKYVSNTMTRNEAREISSRIEEVMKKEKPYMHADLKVGKLAELVGISSHKLSQFFSQHKDLSFYDYINKYRVDEFKRMVKEDDVKNLTLSAMAEKAGFSSRASFFRYFKNIEGISPGEYMKSHEKG